MAELIKKGAEADILLGWWGPLRAIYKVRRPKLYMIHELDLKLRRSRTIREAIMISRAREAGVKTPFIFYVGTKSFTIIMQYIEGPTIKAKLDGQPALAAEIGRALSALHSRGIIHGDPNSANFILSPVDDRCYTVDFGLSFPSNELEDIAVDIHIVKEMLAAQHKEIYTRAIDHFFKGYSEVEGRFSLVHIQKKLREIERRGRYNRQPF